MPWRLPQAVRLPTALEVRLAVRACFLIIFALLQGVSTAAQQPASAYDQVFADVRAFNVKNEYAKAIELLKTIPEDAPPADVVRKHTGIVIAMSNLGRFGEMAPHLTRARDVAERSKDLKSIATVDSAEATSYRMSRRPDLAIPLYLHAAELATKVGDRSMLGRIYTQLASVYSTMEDWERSVYYKQKGFELIEKPTATDRFNSLMDSGIAYFEMHDRDAAESLFKEALALALGEGGKRDQSFALGELGYLYWTFDRDASSAIDFYNRAIALAIEAETPTLLSTWSLNRGGVWRDTGEYEQALKDFRAVLALDEQSQRTSRFPATKNIGQTYRLMGRLEEARAILEKLIDERRSEASPRHLWQAHMELASTYEALRVRDRAEVQYRQMLDVLEEHRNSSILDSFRTGTFTHSLSLYDPYDRYMRFLADDAGQGAGTPAAALGAEASAKATRIADALHVSERARARGFLEMLASVRSAIAQSLPDALVAEQTRILRGISDVQRKLRAADLPQDQRQALLDRLGSAERDRDQFRVKLTVEHPALAEARYPDVAPPRDLQAILRPGETAVIFYLSDPASFRWTVTRDRITLQKIAARKAIESQADRLRGLLRAPGDVAAVRTEAAALSKLILEHLEIAAGAPLVVVPHGVLHYVPFEVLERDGKALIAQHAITYAPSLNSLAHLRRRDQKALPFRVLAVGNPTVDRPDAVAAAARGGDVDAVGLLGPLPFAEDELRAIRRAFRWSTETLSGRDARESTFRAEDLRRYPIIHFATHGLVNEKRPSRSGLLFTAEAGEDGLLQMQEIYRLGLQADLVVLSACQTALGREITGEGIVGLTRAFFYAGSRSVIAALWNLNDRFAADFIARFYDEIRAGQSTEEALRRTKIAFMNHPQFSHPFYWSSLVLTGDGTRVLYRPTGWTTPAIAAGLAVAFGLMAFVFRRRLRRG